MEQGPWSQPSAIYSSDQASFPKGLPDAYQRRLWSENNETKASEEKKNQKVSLSGQQLAGVRASQKMKTKQKMGHFGLTGLKNGHIQLSLERQGFRILN